MALQSLKKLDFPKSRSKKSGEMKKGESVEGHLQRFIETNGEFGKTVSPVIVEKDGEETVIWASGTLKYLQDDFNKRGLAPGTFVKITAQGKEARQSKASGRKYTTTVFDVEIDAENVLMPEQLKKAVGSEY